MQEPLPPSRYQQPRPRSFGPPSSLRPVERPVAGHLNDLRTLRTAYRKQRHKAAVTAFGYFVGFLLLSACAPSLMTITVSRGLSTGLLLGLCQLPVTGLALWLYERNARSHIDPVVARLSECVPPQAERRTVQ